MVSTVGPVSNRKPSRSSDPARPPGTAPRSMTVTAWPRPASEQAAESPDRPAPITTTRRVVVTDGGFTRGMAIV